MNEDTFKAWLEKKQGLGRKSANDVVSRLKRALRFSGGSLNRSEKEFLKHLNGNKEFQKLSVAVMCHLRRAVHLYSEFRRSGGRARYISDIILYKLN